MSDVTFFSDLSLHGDAPALVTQLGDVSYRDLQARADRVGSVCQARRVVLCLCQNSVESIAGYLGFLRNGTVPLLLSQNITTKSLVNLLAAYRPEYIWLPKMRVSEATPGEVVFAEGQYVLLDTGRREMPTHESLALLMTTSGSTGSPKLVRQSYKNITTNACAIVQCLAIVSSDRPITTLPMEYTYGLSIIHSHLQAGAAIVLNEEPLIGRTFWDWLAKSRATGFGGVPYTYQMLKRLDFANNSPPGLRAITQAGGKLGNELHKNFAETCLLKNIRFYVMYGQTEATARMSCLPCEMAATKVGSIGLPIPGGEFILRDERNNEISSPYSAGELVYYGENVTLGYALCREDLARGDDNQGVLYTGDLAYRDADGFYYIDGRMKRFLKIYGNRIDLDELEKIALAHGFVCACTGDDEKITVFSSATDTELFALKNWLCGQIGLHHTSMQMHHVEAIPRSNSGKILYSALVAQVLPESGRATA